MKIIKVKCLLKVFLDMKCNFYIWFYLFLKFIFCYFLLNCFLVIFKEFEWLSNGKGYDFSLCILVLSILNNSDN